MRGKKRSLIDDTSAPDHGSETILRGDLVYVIHPFLKRSRPEDHTHAREPQSRLDETANLCGAIGLEVAHTRLIALQQVRPASFIGLGIVEELKTALKAEEITLLVADCTLTPVQQRNLEKLLDVKVIDRTGLILEIFGERAQTREGVLQVELAHLEYQKGRLVRSWTHLERQRGGGGFMGGPGERQIESDRRQLRDQIALLKKELDKVVQTRDLHRKSRQKSQYPLVALVGYTNAGKSTLFNTLTKAEVMAEDMLFATLDPTMRAITLPKGKKIIISDTVGFISQLPTQLIAAFRATLEEVLEADIIIHVRDIVHHDTEPQKKDVMQVLNSLKVNFEKTQMIEVLNKVDLLEPTTREDLFDANKDEDHISAISAVTGEGLSSLIDDIEKILSASGNELEITLSSAEGQAMAWLYRHSEILDRIDNDDNIVLTIRIDEKNKGQFSQKFGADRLNPKS